MRRRRLAAELHRLRMAAGLTLDEVAGQLECSPAKVSRIENGQVAVRIQDARELLDLYSLGGAKRDGLLQMVRQARGKAWWSAYDDVLDDSSQTLLSLENEAWSILVYEANCVPPLLQVSQYADALNSEGPGPHDRRLVDLRLARQQILGRPDAPALTAIMDEAVLRREVVAAEVMRIQIEYLIEASEKPGIDLRVLPFDSGAHQAMGFSFQIFEFADDDPRLVYIDLLGRAQVLESAAEVGQYRTAFDQVHQKALPPDLSRNFLTNLLQRTA
jgi:transcriptional regulator with XRE-family HTH domain